jgi:phage/plasmid-like protein (TIGR03299 family)
MTKKRKRMASEVETMMYCISGGEGPPWHGLGTYVGDSPVTSEEAIQAAGLDWEVEKRPLWTADAAGNPTLEVDTHMAVGSNYVPVQNRGSFEFMDALVDEGLMRYHTAGSLRNGQRIWLLGKIGQSDILPNDVIDRYLLFWNTHDGSGALRALFTATRVVCANTAKIALSQGKGDGVYLRHTTNIKNRLEKAKEVLGLATKEFDKFEEFAKALTQLKMNSLAFEKFSEVIVPDNPTADSNARAENTRLELANLFEAGRGQDIPGVKGTGWAAYSAVVEFTNYQRSSRGGDAAQERRFESSLFGSGDQLIQKSVGYLQKALRAA